MSPSLVAKTIAFDLTCLHTRHANSSSLSSFGVGARFVATCHLYASLATLAVFGVAFVLRATHERSPLGIAVDDVGPNAYYTNYAGGQLMRVKKDGAGQPEAVLSNLAHPAFLVSDANSLYFTVFGSGVADGMVMRLAK